MTNQNIINLRNQIKKSSKNPSKVKLIVVTKNVGPVRIKQAVKAGVRDIAENKIQEAERKFSRLKKLKFTKHFIGHLQSNKADKAVKLFDFIHSIDSVKIAEKLDEECKKQGKKIKGLLQINISGEKTKHGFKNGDIDEAFDHIKKLKNLEIVGLMTMAPFVNPEYTRPQFSRLKKLAKKLKLKELSMGMTNDYEVALQEGSTMIRIGTAIFRK